MTVTFTSLDPLTGQTPTGVFDGFLPPDNGSGIGEGFVQYTVQPKASLATGTAINQQAAVVFDTNASLATNTVLNTIVAASTLLTDTTKQTAYKAVEGNNTKPQVLTTFTDGNPSSRQSFAPTVSWGGILIGTPTVSVKAGVAHEDDFQVGGAGAAPPTPIQAPMAWRLSFRIRWAITRS